MSSDYQEISNLNSQIDNFECNECKRRFKYESHFLRHVLTHSDSRPFSCECCGKKFKRQDALKTHERSHSAVLPYICSKEDCMEQFASKAALRYHELRHQNQTQFACDISNCNKKFITLGQLKQHQRTKLHSKINQVPQSQFDSFRYEDFDNLLPEQFDQISQEVHRSFINQEDQFKLIPNNAHTYEQQNQTFHQINSEKAAINTSIPSNKSSSSNFHVKKEHRQEKSFLDDFGEDEQQFIEEIWRTVKKESDIQNLKKHDKSNIRECVSEYPLQKRRKQSRDEQESTKNIANNTHSKLLLEFSRSGDISSFGRLKQELRIIVALIDKIKKEDEEIQEQEEVDPSLPTETETKPNLNEDIAFYQNDENPFHDYQCKRIQEEIPAELLDEKEETFNHHSEVPLLKKKIKTAVRLVQFCKKAFIQQRKNQPLRKDQSNPQRYLESNFQTNQIQAVPQMEDNFKLNNNIFLPQMNDHFYGNFCGMNNTLPLPNNQVSQMKINENSLLLPSEQFMPYLPMGQQNPYFQMDSLYNNISSKDNTYAPQFTFPQQTQHPIYLEQNQMICQNNNIRNMMPQLQDYSFRQAHEIQTKEIVYSPPELKELNEGSVTGTRQDFKVSSPTNIFEEADQDVQENPMYPIYYEDIFQIGQFKNPQRFTSFYN